MRTPLLHVLQDFGPNQVDTLATGFITPVESVAALYNSGGPPPVHGIELYSIEFRRHSFYTKHGDWQDDSHQSRKTPYGYLAYLK